MKNKILNRVLSGILIMVMILSTASPAVHASDGYSDGIEELSDEAESEEVDEQENIAEETTDTTSERATLLSGSELNEKLKKLVGHDLSSLAEKDGLEDDKDLYHALVDEKIVSIRMADEMPDENEKTETVVISAGDSEAIYAWAEERFDSERNRYTDTYDIYYYTDAKDIYYSSDASCAFMNLSALEDLSGLSEIKLDETTNISQMFLGDAAITDFSALDSYNADLVTDYEDVFASVNTDAKLPSWYSRFVPSEKNEEQNNQTDTNETKKEDSTAVTEEKSEVVDGDQKDTNTDENQVTDKSTEAEPTQEVYQSSMPTSESINSPIVEDEDAIIKSLNQIFTELDIPQRLEDGTIVKENSEPEVINEDEEGFKAAASYSIGQYYGRVTHFDNRYSAAPLLCGYFQVNYKDGAYCCMHENNPPAVGSSLYVTAIYTPQNRQNELMRKIMYYGWGGPADCMTSRYGAAVGYRYTVLAASVANGHSDNYYGYGQWAINNIFSKKPAAPEGFTVYKISTRRSGYQDLVAYDYQPNGKLTLHKTSADTTVTNGDPYYTLAGAVYGVYSDAACTKQVTTLKTSINGTASVSLKAGTYYVKEKSAPPGYEIDPTVKTVTISTGKTTDVTSSETPYRRGQIKLKKVDAVFGVTLSDAEFTLYRWSNSAGDYVLDSKVVDQKKDVTPIGEWVQKSGKWWYRYPDGSYPTNEWIWDENYKKYYHFDGNGWKDKESTTRPETAADTDGVYDFGYIHTSADNPDGKFKIVETKIPDNYSGSFTKEFTITDNVQLFEETVENTPLPYVFYLDKYDADDEEDKLVGAEFTVYEWSEASKSYKDTPLTVCEYDKGNSLGEYRATVEATLDNVGKFKIVETKYPDNYGDQLTGKKWEKEVVVDSSTPHTLTYDVANEWSRISGQIRLVKTDYETGSTLEGGAVFNVYEWDAKANAYREDPVDTLVYDADAKVYLSTILQRRDRAKDKRQNDGKYKIVEDYPIDGYANGVFDEDADKVNDPWSKEIEITDSMSFDTLNYFDLTVANKENEYHIKKISGNGKAVANLDGAVFHLKRTNDNKTITINVNGEDQKLTSAGLDVTVKNGEVFLKHLTPGTYEYKEVSAPAGFLLDKETYSFKVDEQGRIEDKYSVSKKVTNYPVRNLNIVKKDKDTGTLTVDGSSFPTGTVFGIYEYNNEKKCYEENPLVTAIYRSEDAAFVDETTMKKPVLKWTAKNDGKFRLIELSSSQGYILDKTPIEFSLPANSSGDDLNQEATNQANTIKLKKKDVKGKLIKDGSATIYFWNPLNISDQRTVSTGNTGEITVQRLSAGTWYYREVAAPTGYLLDENIYSFTVDKNGLIDGEKVKELELVNKKAPELKIKKVTPDGKEYDMDTDFPAGTEFDIYEWNETLGDYEKVPYSHVISALDAEEQTYLLSSYTAQGEENAAVSTEEAKEKESDVEKIDTSKYDDLDFTSCRLIVKAADKKLLKYGTVESNYGDVYTVTFDSADETKLGYAYYKEKAEDAYIDGAVLSADNKEVTSSDASDELPLEKLETAVEDSGKTYPNTVALIDTGVADGTDHIKEYLSVLDSDGYDDNGHGTNMANHILSMNPDADIISIKALGSNGAGTSVSIYAAIELAIEKKVSIINLSLYAPVNEKNTLVEEAINDAVNAGITVVGAAGNKGEDAANYIPGRMDKPIIVGACDENGKRLKTSNYGDTVDYMVVASATSEAAAIMTGFLSAGIKIEDFLNKDIIYSTDYEKPEEIVNAFADLDYNIDNFIYLQYGSLSSYFEKITKPSGDIREDYEVLNKVVSKIIEGSEVYAIPEELMTLVKNAYPEKSKDEQLTIAKRVLVAQAFKKQLGLNVTKTEREQSISDCDMEEYQNIFAETNMLLEKAFVAIYKEYEFYTKDPDDTKTVDQIEATDDGIGEVLSYEYQSRTFDTNGNTDTSLYLPDTMTVKVRYKKDGTLNELLNAIGSGYEYKTEEVKVNWDASVVNSTGDGTSITYTPVVGEGYSECADIEKPSVTINSKYSENDYVVASGETNATINYGNKVQKTSGGYTYTYRIVAEVYARDNNGGDNYKRSRTTLLQVMEEGKAGGFRGTQFTYKHQGGTGTYTNPTGGNKFGYFTLPSGGAMGGGTQTGTYTYGTIYDNGTQYYLKYQWGSGTNTYSTATVTAKFTYHKYDANGGTGAPSNFIRVSYGNHAGANYSTTKPTRTGYTFLTWNTAKDGSGTNYAAGSAAPDSNMTLYAQWRSDILKQQVYVRYQNIDGTYGDYSKVYDENHTYGSEFSWSAEDSLDDFEPDVYENANVNYVVDGTEVKETYVDINRKKVNLKVGVYEKAGTNISLSPDVASYTVKVNGETVIQGATEENTIPVYVGATYQLSYDLKTYSSYCGLSDNDTTFNSVSKSLSGTAAYSDDAETYTYRMVYERSYPITYELRGGAGVAENPTTYTVADSFTLKNPTRASAEFIGWRQEDSDVITPNMTIQKGTTGPLKFIAVWKNNISFIDEATGMAPRLIETDNNKGKFVLVETKSAPGYILSSERHEISIDQDMQTGSSVIELTYENTPNELILKKVDVSGNALTGATFDIWYDGEDDKITKTVDENGELKLERLKPGLWHYQETEAPEDCILDDQVYDFTVGEDGNIVGGTTRTVLNAKGNGAFYINKVSDKGEALQGVTFEVSGPFADGSDAKSFQSNASGIVAITGLGAGTYTVKETDALPGYVLNAEPFTFEVNDDMSITGGSTKKFVNDENGVTIKKTDTNGNLIEGAEFTITCMEDTAGKNPSPVVIKTNASGIAESYRFTDGTYKIVETKAPKGYVLDAKETVFKVQNGKISCTETGASGVTKLSIPRTDKKRALTLTKKSSDGSVMKGVQFRIWNADSSTQPFDETLTTNDKGILSLSDGMLLPEGNYKYQEVATLDGYVLDKTVRSFTVLQDQESVSLEAANEKTKIQIKKVDENGNPLAGVTFTLTDHTRGTSEDYTTNASGVITITGKRSGGYTLTEKKGLAGYKPSTKTWSFTIGENGQFVSSDLEAEIANGVIQYGVANKAYLKKSVQLTKFDGTGTNQLSGATFEVLEWNGSSYVSMNPAVTMKEDTTGVYKVENLTETAINQGKFKVVETAAPSGYVVNYSKEIDLNHAAGDTLYLEANNHENSITIRKQDQDGKPLAGVKFKLWKENESYDLVTDSRGYAKQSKLSAGTWYYQESEALDGYKLDATVHQVIVSEDGTVEGVTDYTTEPVINYVKETPEGNVQIKKTDESGNILSDVKFEVLEYNKTTEKYQSRTTLAYNSVTKLYENKAKLSYTESNEGKFKVVETESSSGYVADFEKEFTLDPDGGSNQLFEFTAVNASNKLKVKKLDDNKNPLSGVEFTLTPIHTLVVADPIVKTTVNGYATFENLSEGTYILKETKALNGYAISNTKYSVVVNGFGQIYIDGQEENAKGVYTLEVENKKNKFILEKYNARDKHLNDVEFTFWRTGLPGEDDENTEYERWSETTKTIDGTDGLIKLTGLVDGTYYYQETKVLDGYELDDRIHVFFVKNGNLYESLSNENAEGPGNEGTDTLTVKLRNTTREDNASGSVVVEKLDSKTKEVLSDAEFSVYEFNVETGEYEGVTKYRDAIVPLDTFATKEEAEAALSVTLTDEEWNAKQYIVQNGDMYEEPYAKLEYSNGYYILPSGVKLIATYQNSGRFKVVETKTPAGHVGNWEAEINVYDKSQWEFTGDNAVLNEPSSFTVKKVGEDGEPLAGAVFEIWDSSIIPPSDTPSTDDMYAGLDLPTYTTDENGKIVYKNVKAGTTLYVREKVAPKGHLLDTTLHSYVVDSEGRIDGEAEYEAEISNTKNEFTLKKIAADTKKPMNGVKFEYWHTGLKGTDTEQVESDHQTVVTSNVGGEDGVIQLSGLEDGIYYFHETKTLKGYAIDDEIKSFAIKDGYFYEDANVTGTGTKTYSITVTNEVAAILPGTGGRGNVMLLYIAFAMFALSGMFAVIARRKSK